MSARRALFNVASGYPLPAIGPPCSLLVFSSQPLSADTHLLAAEHATTEGLTGDAAHHAGADLAFAAKTGAVLYQHQAETLTRAGA